MSGIGDFAATLSVSSADWRNGFSDANAVLDRFGANFDATVAGIVQKSEEIAVTARTSALAIGALGVGLKVVGGSGAGLLKVAATLTGISWTVSNLNTAIRNLRPGTSFIQKLTGAIGAVGASAGIATLALKGTSLVLARMKKDTTTVDALALSLGRVATAATVTILGIKAVSLGFAAMRGTASLSIGAVRVGFQGLQAVILAVPRSIGAVAGAMRSIGAAGVGMVRSAAGAIGQFAAAAGDSIGQLGQGFANVATGFAVGGIFGGLATLVGLLMSAGVSMEQLGGVSKTVQKIIEDLTARSKRWMESFKNAIQPLTDAIKNVWLPAIRGGTDQAGNAFSRFFDRVESEWGAWLYDSIHALAEFVGNFDLYFQIAQQSIVLWASNSMLQVQDFFTNMGEWLAWFGENWSDVLFTAFDLASTVFINIGENIRSIFSKIWEWVKSGFTGDIDIDWTPLTDGFRSTIQELPNLTETELGESTPELEQLYQKLGERQAAAAKRGREATPDNAQQADQGQKFTRSPELKASLMGSSEAASILLRGKGGKSIEQIAEKQLAVQQQTLLAVKTNKPQQLQPLTL